MQKGVFSCIKILRDKTGRTRPASMNRSWSRSWSSTRHQSDDLGLRTTEGTEGHGKGILRDLRSRRGPLSGSPFPCPSVPSVVKISVCFRIARTRFLSGVCLLEAREYVEDL